MAATAGAMIARECYEMAAGLLRVSRIHARKGQRFASRGLKTPSQCAMEQDMNQYDLEHVCTGHSRMSQADWQGVYQRAWTQDYSLEHIETLLRRAVADGLPVSADAEPGGVLRHAAGGKDPPAAGRLHPPAHPPPRRPGMPRDFAPLFHVRHWASTAVKLGRLGALLWRVNRIRKRIEAEHAVKPYTDLAITRLAREAEVNLEMLQERPLLEAAH